LLGDKASREDAKNKRGKGKHTNIQTNKQKIQKIKLKTKTNKMFLKKIKCLNKKKPFNPNKVLTVF